MFAHPILGQKQGVAAEALSPLVRVDGDVPGPPRADLSCGVRPDPQVPDGFAIGDYVGNKVVVPRCLIRKKRGKVCSTLTLAPQLAPPRELGHQDIGLA